MRLKIRFLACMLAVICLSMVGQATLAYFTVEETARNVITTGGVNIEILETVDDRGTPWEDVDNVMPGDQVDKIVTVTNRQAEAWVRVWVDVTVTHPTLGEIKLPLDLIRNEDFEIDIDFNTRDWTYNETDGHFYYKTSLATGETTEPLFSRVSFEGEGMGDIWQNCRLAISVQAEAVQTANNPEAFGWNDCGHEIVGSEVIM